MQRIYWARAWVWNDSCCTSYVSKWKTMVQRSWRRPRRIWKIWKSQTMIPTAAMAAMAAIPAVLYDMPKWARDLQQWVLMVILSGFVDCPIELSNRHAEKIPLDYQPAEDAANLRLWAWLHGRRRELCCFGVWAARGKVCVWWVIFGWLPLKQKRIVYWNGQLVVCRLVVRNVPGLQPFQAFFPTAECFRDRCSERKVP